MKVKTNNSNPQPCPRNGAVYCMNQSTCHRCGWNPDVAAARLERIKERLGLSDEQEKTQV